MPMSAYDWRPCAAVELDLLIRSCMGQAKCSIEWCALNPVASTGLAEAHCTLASNFGSPTIITRDVTWNMLGTSDKTKL